MDTISLVLRNHRVILPEIHSRLERLCIDQCLRMLIYRSQNSGFTSKMKTTEYVLDEESLLVFKLTVSEAIIVQWPTQPIKKNQEFQINNFLN